MDVGSRNYSHGYIYICGDLLPGKSLIPLIFSHPSQGCCELVSSRDTSVCAEDEKCLSLVLMCKHAVFSVITLITFLWLFRRMNLIKEEVFNNRSIFITVFI